MTVIRQFVVAAFVLVPAVGVPARAQTDLNRFPLIKAIPADVFIAVAARSNPERQYLDKYWEGVTTAFQESGVLNDVWEMITDSADDEALEKIEEIQEKFSALCKKVNWADLFEKEMIHAGRFVSTPTPSLYEGLVMGRMESAQVAATNYESLKAILEEVVKLAHSDAAEAGVLVQETHHDGVTMAGVTVGGFPAPFLGVGWSKDVICIYFGSPKLAEECFGLLGGSKTKTLVSTERFHKAFDSLPPAEDSLVFFDTKEMFGRLSNFLTMFAGAVAAEDPSPRQAAATEDEPASKHGPATTNRAGQNGDGKRMLKVCKRLLGDVCIVDYVAEVEWTEGYRVFTQSVSPLTADAQSAGLYKVFTSGKPTKEFQKYIPKEAKDFSWSSLCQLTAAYDYVHDLVVDLGPDGEDAWTQFDDFQKNVLELDLRKDVLSLIEGPMIWHSTDDQWVLLLKVTDTKKAEAQLDRLFTEINQKLGDQNGLMLSSVKIHGGHAFRQISHPLMMTMGGLSPPVVGVAEGHLIVASSAKAVSLCLKTAEGKHDNITKNKRWQAEAVKPESDPVNAVSFTDESNTGSELQQAIQGLAMGLGFVGMMAQDAPPQVRQIAQSLPPMLAKLGPVAGKLDFYKSSSGVTTFDGHRWTTRSVQNYKKPEETSGEEENGASSEDEAP